MKLDRFMDNTVAYTLGEIVREVEKHDIGDDIDRGLVLRRLLEENGFTLEITEQE